MVQNILEEDKEEENVQKKFYFKSEVVSKHHYSKLMIMFKRFGLSTNYLNIYPSEWNIQNDYIQG